jgi:hypothetical protein
MYAGKFSGTTCECTSMPQLQGASEATAFTLP